MWPLKKSTLWRHSVQAERLLKSTLRSTRRELSSGGCIVWCDWRGKERPGEARVQTRTNLFTCVRDFIQYARLWKKHFLDYCRRRQQKAMFSNKCNSCSLLCVVISQYSNRVGFISMREAQMGSKGSQSLTMEAMAPCFPSSRRWNIPLTPSNMSQSAKQLLAGCDRTNFHQILTKMKSCAVLHAGVSINWWSTAVL